MIGVFDSGIGGLSVLKALRAELPHEDFTYIADSGHAPYGERDDAHVIDRSRRITAWLAGQNIKALVMACNTATAAAIHLLRAEYPALPLIGVEPALKPAAALSQTKRIGVMATRGTLASAKFQALLQSQADSAEFVLQPCDGLASAIERSAVEGDDSKTRELCEQYIEAMGSFGRRAGEIDTLVLGCTHYPFAEAQLRARLGPDIQIIANGEAIARQLRRQLADFKTADAAGDITLLSTGAPSQLQAAANCWLGLEITVRSLHF